MTQEDRERLVRIETILTEVAVPRINDHGKRIRILEKVAMAATLVWGSACVVAWAAKDNIAGWMKTVILSHHQ